MSSTKRYNQEYMTTTTRAAHQAKQRAAFRACRVSDAINAAILVIGFIGFASVVGFGLAAMFAGAGQ